MPTVTNNGANRCFQEFNVVVPFLILWGRLEHRAGASL